MQFFELQGLEKIRDGESSASSNWKSTPPVEDSRGQKMKQYLLQLLKNSNSYGLLKNERNNTLTRLHRLT